MKIIEFPRRAAWLAGRKRGIGGSDVPAILGLSPWKTPLGVWSEKVGLVESDADGYSLRRGSHMELLLQGEIERAVEETRDDDSLVAGFQPTCPHDRPQYGIVEGSESWMLYSPDGFLNTRDKRTGVESKSLVEFKSHPRGASEWAEAVPPHVVAQVQWGMLVCDLPAAYVAVDLGTEFRWARVERDADWWPTHEATIREFWRRVVEEDAPPAESDDAETLVRMFPRPQDGKTIALPSEFLELRWEMDRLTEERRKIEKAEDEIKCKVRQAMGDAERAVLADGSGWTCGVSSRPAMIPDPSGARHESRVLRSVKAKK